MSRVERTALWNHLKEAALVEGELPVDPEVTPPWSVRIMLGVAGWIGALFLFGFVALGLGFVLESAFASLFIGALLCVAAAGLFHGSFQNDFIHQFGFAVSVAGQVLVLVGLIIQSKGSIEVVALMMMVVEAILFLLNPNFLHRLWCAIGAGFALFFVLSRFGYGSYASALLIGICTVTWLNEFRYVAWGDQIRALGYGSALIAVMTLLFLEGPMMGTLSRVGRTASTAGTAAPPAWIGNALVGAVLIGTLLKVSGKAALGAGRMPTAGAAILAALSLKAPGVGLTATILFVGYAHSNRVLAGLGIFSLLSYLSFYYYNLQITLLEKSILLVCSGAALLAVRVLLKRDWPPTRSEEERDA